MNRWPSRHVLVITGCIAFLLAVAWSALGLVLYGRDMTVNLIAGLAGTSLDIAIAALIVERVMGRHQRSQWDFAYRALARRACEAFVDVMRLVFVRSSTQAHEVNLPRYQHFVELCAQHLDELRSHIEGSSSALDTTTHEQYRRIERRLSWCLGQLRNTPTQIGISSDLLSLLRETAIATFELLARAESDHKAFLAVAESSIGSARSAEHENSIRQDIFSSRLAAQSLLLHGLGPRQRQIFSISQDVDSDFSIPYFMIDYLLLTMDQGLSPQGEAG